MARETKKFKIGDCQYSIQHLKAKPARHALQILTRAAAPVLSSGVTTVSTEGEAIMGMVGRLGQVLDSVKPEDIDRLVELFAEETTVETPQSGGVAMALENIIDDHFTGPRFKDQFLWLKESALFNFSFLVDALSGLSAPKAPEGESESPNTSKTSG